MPTIRYLLDRYGQPPRELALDWAWQIRNRLESHGSSQKDCLLAVQSWTELEVAEDGQLACAELDVATATLALEDLRQWAVGDTALLLHSTAHEEVSESVDSPLGSPSDSLPNASYLLDATSRPAPRSARPGRQRRPFPTRIWWPVGLATGLLVCSLPVVFWPGTQPHASSSSSISADATATTESSPQLESIASTDASLGDSLIALVEPLEPATPKNQVDAGPLVDDQRSHDVAGSSLNPTSIAALDVALSLGSNESGASRSQLASQAAPDQSSAEPATSELPTAETKTGANDNVSAAESLTEVRQAFQQAEQEESIVPANRRRGQLQDMHGDPWILSRDTMRYRVTLAPELNVSARESQWTLALEPIAGLAVEPQKPVTIGPRGLIVWRIYEAESKSPRACLFVRAFHRGRDGQLEMVFCGGAEDMPGMSVPLAVRWLEPLTVRVQSQAIELRSALAQLSTTTILRDQVPAVMQRKQAMTAQMFTSARLGAIMPEIHRLAQLVDGQVTMHAALRSKPGEPAMATWGQIP